MRSLLLILLTIVLLAAGFFTYLWFQPEASDLRSSRLIAATPTTMPAMQDTPAGIGAIERAWVERFDPTTGELTSRFKGERYDPQQDQTVLVDLPQAEFYAADGKQRICIDGKRGRIVLPPSVAGRKAGEWGRKVEAPSRGYLYDGVTISLYEPADAPEPILRVSMDNASFDNDTFRIATEAFDDAAGHRVEADHVPVTVTGRDYDFSGRGLVIRWNERDRQLQLLEVAHGNELKLKNPEILSKAAVAPSARGGETPLEGSAPSEPLVRTRLSSQSSVVLAADVTKKAKSPKPSTQPATQPKPRASPPSIYRATFEKDVRVFQGEGQARSQIASADQLHVYYLESSRRKQPTTGLATSAASPTTAKLKRDKPKPASRPDELPITLNWTGRLRVVPIAPSADRNLTPGKAAVEMIGAPVVLNRESTELRCASAFYNGADSSALLKGSEALGSVRMTDARGSVLITPQVLYSETSGSQKVATLIGPSTAHLPLAREGGSERVVDASWQDRCRLQLITDPQGRTSIDRAHFTGDVRVDDSQLKMSSRELELAFVPAPATRPSASNEPSQMADALLKQAIATGDVRAVIRDSDGKDQTIETQRLSVSAETTPDGQTYAQWIDAEGDVHTQSEVGDLRAGKMTATLHPTTRLATSVASFPPASSPQGLETLIALHDVTFTSPQGTTATGDELRIETIEPSTRPVGPALPDAQPSTRPVQKITLLGNPAKITDGKGDASGRVIRLFPEQQLAEIPGAGALHGSMPDSGEVIDLSWAGGAIIDGVKNQIDVDDRVTMRSTESDGTISSATSRHLVAFMTDKPSTRPARATGATEKTRARDQPQLLADKDITFAILGGKVQLKSEQNAPDGSLLRGFDLFAERVSWDKATGRLDVPVPGRMLYRDHRPAAEPGAEGPTLGSGRGATAFQWGKSLLYSEVAKQAVLSGDVVVAHTPPSKDAESFKMHAQTVTADFQAPPAATRPADPPVTTRPASEKLRLKLLHAHEAVRVETARMTFDAQDLKYDPLTQWLTASGSEGQPGRLFDSQTGSTQVFEGLKWNTKTDEFQVINFSGRIRQ